MKKLLISALVVVAALVAVDLSANTCCRKKRCAPRCETVCEQPKRGRVCETVHTEAPMPNVRCLKYVPQESCCNVIKHVDVTYEAACPPGFTQEGDAYNVTEGTYRRTKLADKAAGYKAARTGKFVANEEIDVAA